MTITEQNNRKPLRFRQIHLDFHTSEHINNIGAKFDPEDFAQTLKNAHVNSVTIFAKCHHGWSYYPTKVGYPHPHLSRPDLLGDMLKALAKVDIESPVYITVQWDEKMAREHPEWRVLSASNNFAHSEKSDHSSARQLSPAWHTMCINHAPLRQLILDQAREVALNYDIPGLFFDIVFSHECVCTACIDRMLANGLDPEKSEDRKKNDAQVIAQFKDEISTALFKEFPHLRIFYNAGHIEKAGIDYFKDYTHLELESLPTGGWGYSHFPSSARYVATLGLDFLAHTGKFHSSWGEFGGFKHPDALEYECAQMVALGSKCLIGDQLHPDGSIDHSTYASIAPAYARIEKLEPYLWHAKQVSEIAVLSAEHMDHISNNNHASDNGVVQMLLELQRPFDMIDINATFENYRLIILPDTIRIDDSLAKRLKSYIDNGGKIIASWYSGQTTSGEFALDFGLKLVADTIDYQPSYVITKDCADSRIPNSPVIFYDSARQVQANGAKILSEILPPYFNRNYKHFSSHLHAPYDSNAKPLGVATAIHNSLGYIAYPIFRLYRAIGQPIYRHIVNSMINELIPTPVVSSNLSSTSRLSLTHQIEQHRYILHILYGAPQIRGQALPMNDGSTRIMELIEDIPTISDINATVRLPQKINRIYNALTEQNIEHTIAADGAITISMPKLKIHAAIVFEYEQD